MLLLPFSFIFLWIIYRELTGSLPVNKYYLLSLIFFAAAFAWPEAHFLYFQHYLNTIALKLTEGRYVNLHCNTLFDTLFDERLKEGGHADPRTGYIVIQYPRCYALMDYLKHPASANKIELVSLNILTHESMHIRGEYNEAITECESVQRNKRTAMLMGVPEYIASQNAMDYYTNYYLTRSDAYFSKECKPGKALDEHLSDSSWY